MEGTGEGQGQATATPEQTNPQAQGGQASPQAEAGNQASEAAKEAMRKFKVKVDGKDLEVDEDELKRGYAHQQAANKRFQEGNKAKKMAEDFMKAMKDPGSLVDSLYKLGYEKKQVRELAESFLAGELEEELLDPREKELKDARAKIKHFEDLEKKQKEESEKRTREEMKKKFSESYTSQFIEALKETSLPPTKAMIGEMAKYIKRAADINFEMTPAEAAKLVKEDMEKSYQRLYGEADAETLIKLIGEQGLQKVRDHDTQRLKDPNRFLETPKEQGEPQRQRGSGKRNPMSPQQWRAFNRAK